MNAWKLGYASLFGLALLAPACGGDSEGDDDGSGGSTAGSSSGKGGSGKGGSSSAGTSNAGTGSGGKGSAGTGNSTGGSSSAGTGSSGDGGTSGSGGNPTECNPEDIAMDPMTGEVPEECTAYVDCVETCYEPLTACFEDGGACNGYVSCIDDCDCEQECVATNCVSEFNAECIACALPASVCIAGCQDEAAECM
jgi:hypothetical protein